ncbi:MAG: hypothetical protein IMX03_04445 [Brockia lithotrophica]|nr:hypothetical protein [Brockia lithotrophica]
MKKSESSGAAKPENPIPSFRVRMGKSRKPTGRPAAVFASSSPVRTGTYGKKEAGEVLEWMRSVLGRAKEFFRAVLLPVILVYFLRTLISPTTFDVFVLLVLFLLYVGALLDWY